MVTFASTFLSHASADKPLVEAVATELGKRGILAWLDKDELEVGDSLTEALSRAIQHQATLCIFLSTQSVASDWVKRELTTALRRFEDAGQHDHIKPIYLGDPIDLVNALPLLQGWLDPTGKQVNKLGIVHNPDAPIDQEAPRIADIIARGIYTSLGVSRAHEILIHLDQRGSTRRGLPRTIPDNHRQIEGPALVFRPRRSKSHDKETLLGAEWSALATTVRDALDIALEGRRWNRPKRIYLSGCAQVSLAWLIGRHLDRTGDAVLFCDAGWRNRFNNEGWHRNTPLPGGNPRCESNLQIEPPSLPKTPFNEAILILSTEYIAKRTLPYLSRAHPDVPVAWVRTPDNLNDSEELKALVADISALMQRLEIEHGCHTAYLVIGLPLASVPILAAHLRYTLKRFVVLEYRGDVEGEISAAETYAVLEFPR